MQGNFKDVFMGFDRRINSILGDDITVSPPGDTPVEIKAVLRLETENEELLSRFEEDISTLEILEDDLHLFVRDTVVTFEDVNYRYVTDMPKGVGRHLVILTEII